MRLILTDADSEPIPNQSLHYRGIMMVMRKRDGKMQFGGRGRTLGIGTIRMLRKRKLTAEKNFKLEKIKIGKIEFQNISLQIKHLCPEP